jgi:hypothetical protein
LRDVVVGLTLATFGCTTTHELGRAADPLTRATLQRAASQPGAYARVERIPGASPGVAGYPVVASMPEGLVIRAGLSAPVLVSYAGVHSVSTFDRLRGARDGALILGIMGLVIGATVGALVANANPCSDGCPRRNATSFALVYGGLVGLSGAVWGAVFGVLGGHQDRYVIAPPEP